MTTLMNSKKKNKRSQFLKKCQHVYSMFDYLDSRHTDYYKNKELNLTKMPNVDGAYCLEAKRRRK